MRIVAKEHLTAQQIPLLSEFEDVTLPTHWEELKTLIHRELVIIIALGKIVKPRAISPLQF